MHKMNLEITCYRKPGLMIRLGLILERRGYEVDSYIINDLNDGKALVELAIRGDQSKADQVKKQIAKLIDIVEVEEVGVLVAQREFVLSM